MNAFSHICTFGLVLAMFTLCIWSSTVSADPLTYASVNFNRYSKEYQNGYHGNQRNGYYGKKHKRGHHHEQRMMENAYYAPGTEGLKLQDERIYREGVRVDPYMGPIVPGQQDRNMITVRDRHQQLLIVLIVLSCVLVMSCIPMCFILWCCIFTGRRIRKWKVEEAQKAFDLELSPSLTGTIATRKN